MHPCHISDFRTIISNKCVPVSLGGDHLITYPILRACAASHGPLAVIHVDAHSGTAPSMMGEDTRLYISNNTGPGAVRLAGGGVGARLYRGQRQGGRRTGGDGDSDGMMGSGGESDSSEEIHYGPGFVSRYQEHQCHRLEGSVSPMS